MICGWFESPDDPEMKHLRLSVNGLKTEPISASFIAVVGQPNRWQFEARLENASSIGDVIRVQLGPTNSHLAGSPWVVREKPKIDFEYAFLHVPKTAGTSLRMSLETALGSNAVFPSQDYLSRRGGGYPNASECKAFSCGLSDEVKVLQGHLQLPHIRALAPNARVIAIFREPVERALSLIKHRLASTGEQDISENDIAERFLNRPHGGIANGQLRALIGKSGLEGAGKDAVALATEALAGIDFLATSDNYAELLFVLGEAIGIPLKNQRLNTTRMADRQFSEAFVDRVRELNLLDISFYKKLVAEVATRAKR